MGEVEPHFEGVEVVAEGEFETHAAVDGAGVGGDEVLVYLDGVGNGVHDGSDEREVFFLVAQVPSGLFSEAGATGDAVELSVQYLHECLTKGINELRGRGNLSRLCLRSHIESLGQCG